MKLSYFKNINMNGCNPNIHSVKTHSAQGYGGCITIIQRPIHIQRIWIDQNGTLTLMFMTLGWVKSKNINGG